MYHLGINLIHNSKLGVSVTSFSRNFCSFLFKELNNSKLVITVDKGFLNIMKGNQIKPFDHCLKSKRLPNSIFISNSLFHNTCWLQSKTSSQDKEKRKNIIFIMTMLTILAVYGGLSLNIVEHQDNVIIDYPGQKKKLEK